MTWRVAVRSLIKSKGYSAVVLLTLALGIGANTAIFCVLNAVLLRPLPYNKPDDLILIWNLYGKSDTTRCNVSPPDYYDRKDQSTTLENVAAFVKTGLALVDRGEPEQINTAYVTASLFPTLGTPAAYGRSFLESDDEPNSNPVVMLSYQLWQRRFGKDKSILGKTLNLGGKNYLVVGVMPKNFWFPDQETELWVPLIFTAEQRADSFRGNEFLTMIGRIKQGKSFKQVQAEMSTIAARVIERVPDRRDFLLSSGWDAEAVTLRESLFGEVRPTLLLLMCATGFLLLLACANIANLVMTRNMERSREVAIRVALGAGRTQLMSMFLSESIVLSLCGGLLGLLLAYVSFGLIRIFSPQDVPRIMETSLDWTVLTFAAGASLISGLLFGLTPLRMTQKTDLSNSLKEGSHASAGKPVQRFRKFLVFSEVAIALILFAGAILFARSFMNLLNQNAGFHADQRITFGITLPQSQYPEAHQRIQRFNEIQEKIRQIPGVMNVGANAVLPMAGENWTATFEIQGYTPSSAEPPLSFEYRIITADYVRAMGIPLLRGRDFNSSDTRDAKRVVLIDEKLAKKYWPNQDPIGRYIGFDSPRWREVIGVVGHVRNVSLSQEGLGQVYMPFTQMTDSTMYFVIHTQRDPASMLPEVRRHISSMDRALPLYRIQTMDQLTSKAVAKPRFQVLLLGSFALVALLLAAVGIYGVVSYSVNQRRNEIGVRMALGATHSMILLHVIQTSMVPVVLGAIAGVLGSMALNRLIQGLLYGISAINFVVLGAAAILILLTALAATFLPARRAARTDAAVVLRSE